MSIALSLDVVTVVRDFYKSLYFLLFVEYDCTDKLDLWQGMPIICRQSYLSFSYRVVVRSICVDLQIWLGQILIVNSLMYS